MKTLLVVLGAALAIGHANAQKIKSSDIPEAAKKGLQQNFGVKDAGWSKEGENFEASFVQRGSEVSVIFSSAGSILETEREINKKELPVTVLASLQKEYKDYNVEEAARIETNGVITFEAEVEKGEHTLDLIFDPQGKLLKKIVKEEDEG